MSKVFKKRPPFIWSFWFFIGNNEQNTKSSHKIEAKSSELHNTCYTNEGDNKDELQTAHAAVVGPSAEGYPF